MIIKQILKKLFPICRSVTVSGFLKYLMTTKQLKEKVINGKVYNLMSKIN